MATGPKARVNAPPLTPPRHSLLRSFDPVRETDERWVNGLRYSPERCEGGGTVAACTNTSKTLDQADNAENIEYEPFAVWAGSICNTLDPEFGIREGQARARRLLAACESKHAAEEFWEGALTQASSWPNFYLRQSGATILSGASDNMSPAAALACLEQAIAECSCNGVGVIHATRQVVTYWIAANLLTSEANGRLYTYLGNSVVADSGYTGNAPTGVTDLGGTVWAYATSEVSIRLGKVIDLPPASNPVQAVDRSINDAIWRVERPVAITVDECCHAAVGIEVEQCQNLQFAS